MVRDQSPGPGSRPQPQPQLQAQAMTPPQPPPTTPQRWRVPNTGFIYRQALHSAFQRRLSDTGSCPDPARSAGGHPAPTRSSSPPAAVGDPGSGGAGKASSWPHFGGCSATAPSPGSSGLGPGGVCQPQVAKRVPNPVGSPASPSLPAACRRICGQRWKSSLSSSQLRVRIRRATSARPAGGNRHLSGHRINHLPCSR